MTQTSPIQALQQQRLLLQLEYETEKEAFRQQTQQMGMERKVKRGDAWWPIKFSKSYYNSLNQLAVEVVRTADTDIEQWLPFLMLSPLWICKTQKGWASSSRLMRPPTA